MAENRLHESEGMVRGRGLFTIGINPWPTVLQLLYILPDCCCYYCKHNYCTCVSITMLFTHNCV